MIFFLKNHALNVLKKLVLDPFLIKSKLSISLDQPDVLWKKILKNLPTKFEILTWERLLHRFRILRDIRYIRNHLQISFLVLSESVWNFILSFFLHVQVKDYKSILELRNWPLAFSSYKDVLKNKRSGTSLPTSFSA